MVCPCVQRVAAEDIKRLVTRLESYGPQTAKMRCFLLLLQSGVNDFEHWIYASEDEPAQPLVALVITLSLPDLLVVDAFAEDDPASQERLCAALLSPLVSARLWQSDLTVRAECWPRHLQPALERATGRRGFSTSPISVGAHMFVREVGPDDAEQWPELGVPVGVAVRPLSASHLAEVLQHWPYQRDVPDAEAMLRRSVESGLSAGVFLLSTGDSGDPGDSGDSGDSGEGTAPLPAGRLVSWIVMNLCGELGFAHTIASQRRRGFARLAVADLTRRCARRGLPVAVATGRDNAAMLGAMRPLAFAAVHDVFWAAGTPPPPPPAAHPTQAGASVRNTTGA